MYLYSPLCISSSLVPHDRTPARPLFPRQPLHLFGRHKHPLTITPIPTRHPPEPHLHLIKRPHEPDSRKPERLEEPDGGGVGGPDANEEGVRARGDELSGGAGLKGGAGCNVVEPGWRDEGGQRSAVLEGKSFRAGVYMSDRASAAIPRPRYSFSRRRAEQELDA